MPKNNPVVHFEMPYEDAKRLSEFYGNVFGWKMEESGAEMGNYVMAETTETDRGMGRPKAPGTINGGFFKLDSGNANYGTSIVISVDNIDEAIEKVKKAGGSIAGMKMEIPGIGWYVSIKDTEGNRVGILQPPKM